MLRALLLFAALGSIASAGTIEYIVGGLFRGDAASTPFSDPNAAFTVEFLLPDQPVPASSDDSGFPVTPSMQFFLNSVDVPFDFGVVNFYSSVLPNPGLLDARLTLTGTTYTFAYLGDQLFSGATSAPVMLTGFFGASAGSAGGRAGTGDRLAGGVRGRSDRDQAGCSEAAAVTVSPRKNPPTEE